VVSSGGVTSDCGGSWRRFLVAVAGDLGGELGAGGDVELGEHVHQVGVHGPP